MEVNRREDEPCTICRIGGPIISALSAKLAAGMSFLFSVTAPERP
jgi:hypothetical protein